MKLVFATNNNYKLKEISHIIGNNIELISLSDLNIREEISEDFLTIEENALAKARYIHCITGMDVFADDTGLEIEALGGAPGVHSARFAGDDKNFDKNIDKVLELLTGIENRKAVFRTVIALIIKGREYLFEGKVTGIILNERRGKEGFGYDPVFLPDGYDRTFAEMTLEEKNRISHRASAFMKLKTFLAELK